MIYLPEAEVIRRDLEREIVGRKIKDVTVSVAKVVKRAGNRTIFKNELVDNKLKSLERKGINFVFTLTSEKQLVIIPSETTTIRHNANKDATEDDTVAVIQFTQNGQLRLIDPEGAVEMLIISEEDNLEEIAPELAHLGLDPLGAPIAWTEFGREILRHEERIKTVLTDESIIAGIGDIYSDEILFEASLRYDRIGSELSPQELRRFYRALVAVLNDAVKYKGTSIESSPFVDPQGEEGTFGEHLQVYEKHGEASPRSCQPLVRSKIGGRWTYYCEQSQV